MITVTGQKGYIGTGLAHFFEKKGCEVRRADVRGEISEDIFDGSDTVIHTAGIVHNKKADKALYERVNINLTKTLAEYAKKSGVRHFVFFSSMSVYGMTEGEITSGTVPHPLSEYGKSKLAAEEMLLEMRTEDFKVTIVRPPMVYGKGCPGNYALLSKLVKCSPVFPLVDNKRSMIYVENLCACVYKIVEDGICGVIHPQNSEYVNTSNMCALIAECCNKKLYLPRSLGNFVSKININIVKKVFDSLYYSEDIAFSNDIVDFETSIMLTEKG